MVLLAALAVFGVFITLKLLRSAAPSVERAIKNSNRMVEQNTDVETKSTPETTTTTTITTASGTSFVVQNINIDTWNKLGRTNTDESEEDDWEAEEDLEELPEEEPAAKSPSAQEFSYTLEDVGGAELTPAPKRTVAAKPAPKPVPVLLTRSFSYQEGLLKCMQEKLFPCKWQDKSQDRRKHYRLDNMYGPLERITYAKDGTRLSRTLAMVDGTVLYYQGAFAELYFSEGLLARIRTFPYDNPNLRDWFVIDASGRLSTCLCGMPTKACCARSLLYREGGHRKYCELFPLDTDFCER